MRKEKTAEKGRVTHVRTSRNTKVSQKKDIGKPPKKRCGLIRREIKTS